MILVTGGAGVLGSRLVKGLVSRGHKVRVLTLQGDPLIDRLSGLGCEIVYGDIAEAGSLKGIFDGIKTVYHLAAIIIAYDRDVLWRINVVGTENIVSGALDAGVEHFIYISSVSAAFPEGSDYAKSKLQAEQIVKSQNKMRYTIVRPALIYGKDQGQEFMMFMDSLKKYAIVPFVGQGRAMKNPVLADDIVEGLLPIAGNPNTYGKTYNFSGGEEISMYDLARLMLKSQGMIRPILRIPLPACQLIAFVLEMTMKRPPLTRYGISRIEHNAASDNTEARVDLGYNPVGVNEGLQLCYGPFEKKY